MLGGANGSGKTTFAKAFLKEKKGKYYFLNADEIAKSMAHDKAAAGSIAAGKEYFAQLQKLKKNGDAILLESTLSGKFLKRLMEELKRDGFRISLVYMFLDTPQLCKERVRSRVLLGGHHIPEADIERRFYRGIDNFWRSYRKLADRWHIYSNADEGFRHVASGTASEYTIMDREKFDQFCKLKEKE